MHSEPVIRVDNITKTYRLYDTHADRVKEAFHPFRKQFHRTFNALTKVTFDIRRGDSVGIVGRNGSGKSTLLQVICGILKPSSGSVSVQGRIGALLELGAGFNPEFTGQENVYLNASILGLSKKHINKAFDSIVAFADIGEFINQPVKTYSSGMYVRLAFAVSISIEPDILIVDEALAVGDELFQRKCFSKIKALQERGTTILFVSHAAGIILELCDHAVLLDRGKILLQGDPKNVITKYHQLLYTGTTTACSSFGKNAASVSEGQSDSCQQKFDALRHPPVPAGAVIADDLNEYFDPTLTPNNIIVYADNNDHGVSISDVRIETPSGRTVNNLILGNQYYYKYRVSFLKPALGVRFGMLIKTVSGLEICGATTSTPFDPIEFIEHNCVVNVFFCFRCLTHPGVYFMNAGVLGTDNGHETFLDRRIDILMYRVLPKKGLRTNALVAMDVDSGYAMSHKNS